MHKAKYFESSFDIVNAMYNEILSEMQQIAKFDKNNEAHQYALYLAGSFLKNKDRSQVIKYYSDDKLRVLFIEKNPKTTFKEVEDENATFIDRMKGKNKKIILVTEDPMDVEVKVSLNFNFLNEMIIYVSKYPKNKFECIMFIE